MGENAKAAETAGLSVHKIRYFSVILSGVLGGLGGAFLSLGQMNLFQEEWWQAVVIWALGAVTMGRWSPIGAFASSMFFRTVQRDTALRADNPGNPVPSEFIQMIPYLTQPFGSCRQLKEEQQRGGNRRQRQAIHQVRQQVAAWQARGHKARGLPTRGHQTNADPYFLTQFQEKVIKRQGEYVKMSQNPISYLYRMTIRHITIGNGENGRVPMRPNFMKLAAEGACFTHSTVRHRCAARQAYHADRPVCPYHKQYHNIRTRHTITRFISIRWRKRIRQLLF